MCGITGFFSPSKVIKCDNFYDSHLLIKHRGPDDEGFISKQNSAIQNFRGDDTTSEYHNLQHIKTIEKTSVILGHRRLSIIDTSSAGHQPYNFRNLSMTYNGEIYNYKALRKELIQKGYEFSTKTDTEVLLKGYHCWGNDLPNKLNGMWAFAIYNSDKNSLTLIRDRFGIKPLYYTIYEGRICFASEMKFILSFLGSPFSVNKKTVSKYMHNAKINDSDQTIWNEISELEPGHILEFTSKGAEQNKYWELSDKKSSKLNISNDPLEEFTYLFEDSLKLRLRSDVEVGSLLSGGLDSSTIVSTLFNQKMVSNSGFNTYSAIFKEKEYSEEDYILDTIDKYKIRNSFTYPNVHYINDYMEDIQHYIEDPFRSLSVFSQYSIYENISKNYKTKVLLNGQGSDEMFSGYSYHYYPFFIDLLKHFKLANFKKEFSLWKSYRNFNIGQFTKQMLFYLINYPLSSNTLQDLSINEVSQSPLREYLKYDDRTSMAFGLESRVPFLDHRLVEFSASLNTEYRIQNFTNKRIVRMYSKDKIATSILERKDKQGFVSPQEIWQRNEMKDDLDKAFLEIKKSDLLGYMPGKPLYDLYSKYQNHKNNNWSLVWRIYNLNLWYKQWCQ